MLLNPFTLERAYNETRKSVRPDARTKMRKRRYNALKKAYERLIENPYINYENGEMLILSDTVTEKGEPKFYRTSAKEFRLILDRLREFRPAQTATVIDAPQDSAQSNSVQNDDEEKPEDEFLGVIDTATDGDISVEENQSVVEENSTQTEDFSTTAPSNSTGNPWLDTTNCRYYENYSWDEETVEFLTKSCKEAQNMLEKTALLDELIEANPKGILLEMISLWNNGRLPITE